MIMIFIKLIKGRPRKFKLIALLDKGTCLILAPLPSQLCACMCVCAQFLYFTHTLGHIKTYLWGLLRCVYVCVCARVCVLL